ncbi:MAG: glycosyltransferase family 9 protein [Candidatus Omnitrophota bacterium]
MFRLDYWVGRPLCKAISLLHEVLEKILSDKAENIPPNKIMFLELSEMGAAILAYSAIKEAQKSYPEAKFYFWIFKENAESVYALGVIPEENVITLRNNNLFVLLLDVLRNLKKIRKEKIDTVIDMELFSRFTSLLTYFSGARKRIGFHKFTLEGLSRAEIYTHKVIYNPYQHISKNFLALVKAIEYDCDAPLLKIPLDSYKTIVPVAELANKDLDAIWDKLKKENELIDRKNRIVVLNPGVGEYLFLRRWPIENYIELSNRMFEDENVFVVLIGLKSESAELTDMNCLSQNKRFVNLIGKTTVREMIALCNIASLFISHDSGAANLASLTLINAIVLFGPETPVLYAPLKDNKKILYKNLACSPCFSAYNHRASICRDNKCLKAITVDEVYECSNRF